MPKQNKEKENNQTTNITGDPQDTPSSWFKIGDEGYNEMKRQEALSQKKREGMVNRFYLKQGGEEAVIVFLDNPKDWFTVWEHELKLNPDSKEKTFLTCTKVFDDCDICLDKGDSTSYLSYGTIIDTRKYISKKDGQEVMIGKSLFGAKKGTLEKIRELVKTHGDLRGLAFKVVRLSMDTEPRVGSVFNYLGKVDLKKQFGAENIEPFDYRKVLAPPTKEQLEIYGISHTVHGSDDDINDKLELKFL